MKIAYLGPTGTFTEAATRKLFGLPQYQLIPKSSIPIVMEEVVAGKMDAGVVPIENSIEGTVNLTTDWLIREKDLQIQAEISFPIVQCAFRHPYFVENDQEVSKVFSHPQAIAQSKEWLYKRFPNASWEYTDSTAEGAKIVAESPEEPWIAIGPEILGDNWNLHLIAKGIQDSTENRTRFIVVSQKEELKHLFHSTKQKTSLQIITPDNKPGALHQILSPFAWRNINLSRIESRPTKEKLGSYFFLLDIENSIHDILLQAAIEELESLGNKVSLLGSYPSLS